MPVLHSASFSALFADQAHDPHHGEFTQLLAPFDIDVNNTATAMLPKHVRSLVATTGSHHVSVRKALSLHPPYQM